MTILLLLIFDSAMFFLLPANGVLEPSPIIRLRRSRIRRGYKYEAFDKEQIQSYAWALVRLGDADLNAVFHLLGINSKIADWFELLFDNISTRWCESAGACILSISFNYSPNLQKWTATGFSWVHPGSQGVGSGIAYFAGRVSGAQTYTDRSPC